MRLVVIIEPSFSLLDHRSSPQSVISKDKKMATIHLKSAVSRGIPANIVKGKIRGGHDRR